MGFFDKLFGGPDYPELDPASTASARLQGAQEPLSSLAEKTKDRLEVVPAQDKAFVFVGKPPKQFGLAWVKDGKVCNLKSYLDEHHVDKTRALKLVEALTDAYRRSQDAPRYTAQLSGHKFVVTPSDRLAGEVEQVLQKGIEV